MNAPTTKGRERSDPDQDRLQTIGRAAAVLVAPNDAAEVQGTGGERTHRPHGCQQQRGTVELRAARGLFLVVRTAQDERPDHHERRR